ncbi:MAG TPA: hypothetical protein OIL86_09245 [Eggerthellaceae bacterium]|nr:hypothetical protein [Eggerthellaceae bacterium]
MRFDDARQLVVGRGDGDLRDGRRPAGPMAPSRSASRVTSVLFVSTDTPKPNSSTSSSAPRVTRSWRSKGL